MAWRRSSVREHLSCLRTTFVRYLYKITAHHATYDLSIGRLGLLTIAPPYSVSFTLAASVSTYN